MRPINSYSEVTDNTTNKLLLIPKINLSKKSDDLKANGKRPRFYLIC